MVMTRACILTTMTTFILSLLSVLALGTSASVYEDCVLQADGKNKCTRFEALSLPIVRKSGSQPCEMRDMNCWCVLAVKYTNDVRKKFGKRKMLKVGPVRQLDNALQYAKVLSGLGGLTHQNLGDATREVGCQRWIGGENIAYNYNRGDIAKACVVQWENSQGHLENILQDRFDEVVVGFQYGPGGRVYCVQTFSYIQNFGTFGNADDSRCQDVSASPTGGGTTSLEPSPSQIASAVSQSPKPVSPKPLPTQSSLPVMPSSIPATFIPSNAPIPSTASPSQTAPKAPSSLPCAKEDMKCWCLLSIEYTNDMRTKCGKTRLTVGPMKQLENALHYARLKASGDYQAFYEARREVGCQRWIGGRLSVSGYFEGDIAKACINWFENHRGAKNIMLNDRYEQSAVGFHRDRNGRVWCVQTFSHVQGSGTFGSQTDPRCEPVST